MGSAVESPAPPKQMSPVAVVAIVVGASVFVLNGLFFVMSTRYFAGKIIPDAADRIASARLAFAIFSVTVGAGVIGATVAPRWVSHGLAALFALGSLAGAIFAFSAGFTPVLGVSLLGIGVALPLMSWRSLVQSRAAWSFLLATHAVLGLVSFFGAPKIRGVLGVNFWLAMIIPGLFVVAAVAFGLARRDYRQS